MVNEQLDECFPRNAFFMPLFVKISGFSFGKEPLVAFVKKKAMRVYGCYGRSGQYPSSVGRGDMSASLRGCSSCVFMIQKTASKRSSGRVRF